MRRARVTQSRHRLHRLISICAIAKLVVCSNAHQLCVTRLRLSGGASLGASRARYVTGEPISRLARVRVRSRLISSGAIARNLILPTAASFY